MYTPSHMRIRSMFLGRQNNDCKPFNYSFTYINHWVPIYLHKVTPISPLCPYWRWQSVKDVHSLCWPPCSPHQAWLVTFLSVDDVVHPEEGVIDLDWHKQPVPCLACHTTSLGHCSMPECQMRKSWEHTGWWPAHNHVGHRFGADWSTFGQKWKGLVLHWRARSSVSETPKCVENQYI